MTREQRPLYRMSRCAGSGSGRLMPSAVTVRSYVITLGPAQVLPTLQAMRYRESLMISYPRATTVWAATSSHVVRRLSIGHAMTVIQYGAISVPRMDVRQRQRRLSAIMNKYECVLMSKLHGSGKVGTTQQVWPFSPTNDHCDDGSCRWVA